MSDVPATPEGGALDTRLAALERQLAELRQLVARAYEGTPAAAARLQRLRQDARWQDPYGSDPLVTVRIGVHRGGDLLFARALRSVRAQTRVRWEAVVVCDGPEPETVERIAALGDTRIRCFERPRNGPYPDDPHARWLTIGTHPFNDAVGLARGAWIAPIDHDDEWTSDHLAVLLDRARERRAEVVYGRMRACVEDEGETWFGCWPPRLGDFGFQAAIYHAGLAGMLYDANAHLVGEPGDWNLARRMLEAGVRFDHLERIVGTYHVNARTPEALAWWRARIAERGPAGAGFVDVEPTVVDVRPEVSEAVDA